MEDSKMKLEYLHGQRITKLIHEMTPLEMAIQSYEEAAQGTLDRYEALAKPHSANDTTKTEVERKRELAECLRFLVLERLKLEKIADVQGQLAAYRESAMAATRCTAKDRYQALRRVNDEKHHPYRRP